MTNVQTFANANKHLAKAAWIQAFMIEFDCDAKWAECKFNQVRGA